jgi:hypothetical protein
MKRVLKLTENLDFMSEHEYCIVNDSLIITGNECESFNRYGQKTGCYNAGCYALDNTESNFFADLCSKVEEKFNLEFKNEDGKSFSFYRDVYMVSNQEPYNLKGFKEGLENLEFNGEIIDEIISFSEKFIEEEEIHNQSTRLEFWDGRNWKSETIEADNNPYPVYEFVNEELEKEILEEYEKEFSNKYSFYSSNYADDPAIAWVNKK